MKICIKQTLYNDLSTCVCLLEIYIKYPVYAYYYDLRNKMCLILMSKYTYVYINNNNDK